MTYDFAPQFTFLLLANAVSNLGITLISFTRLRMMRDVLWRVKIQYVLLFVVSIAAAASPMLFRTWPSGVSLSLSTVFLYVLWTDSYQWPGHAPSAAITHPAPLSEAPNHAD